MHYYGCSDSVVKWFKNYLTNRSNIVKVNGECSSEVIIKKGIPQGSILGPILFTIFTSDLSSRIHSNMAQYADDTQIYLSCYPSKVNDCIFNINKDIETIYEWSLNNGLLINADKTVAMCCGSNVNRAIAINFKSSDIIVNGKVIEFDTVVKNLGVCVDVGLKFEDHVTKSLSLAYSKFKVLYKFKKLYLSGLSGR